jgi:hypothetical protein
MTVNFDIISPIRGQRKMPSERSSADTTYVRKDACPGMP